MKNKHGGVRLWMLTILACLVMALPAVASAGFAPLNPAFLQYQNKKTALATAAPLSLAAVAPAAGTYGYIPAPITLPHLQQQWAALPPLPQPPASYDLRALGKVTPVRDQGICAASWAFGAMGSLESNLLTVQSRDFSENNMKNMAGFSVGPCDGGNAMIATAYLARVSGPVNESDDPYNAVSGVSTPNLPVQKIYTDVTILPARATATDNDAIKQAVLASGAVMVSYYDDPAYYNATNHAYYNDTAGYANHAVSIVGWDDAYSAANFTTTPAGDGAFIARNSWGAAWGDNGYFYISYYDATLAKEESYLFKAPANALYNKVYQYDTLGWTNSFGFGDTTAWFSNVFTATSSDNLTAVSFYSGSINADYQIDVYTGVTGVPTSGTLRGTTTGTMAEAGYHTVTLATPVALVSGQKFSVVVKLNTPDFPHPIPIEDPLMNYADPAKANAGESFVSADGVTWADLTVDSPDKNVCLKAFTVANDNGQAPTVTAITPADKSINVAATTAITATFSEQIDPSTIGKGSFYLSNGVNGTVTYDPNTRTATFTPSNLLAPHTTYTATITTDVKDLGGHPMTAAKTWTFSTAAVVPITFDELGHMQLVPAGYRGFTWSNFYSANGKTLSDANVYNGQSLAPGYYNGTVSPSNIIFNGGSNQASISSTTPFIFNSAYLTAALADSLTRPTHTVTVKGLSNGVVLYTKTITLSPNTPTAVTFAYAGVDQVTFDSTGGQVVVDNVVVNDSLGPEVASTSPAANASGVSIKSAVKATFSTPVKASTVTGSTFKVNGVTGTVAYDDPSVTATFTPSAPLDSNTTYTATVTTGVTDPDGKPLLKEYSWSFTTGVNNTVSGVVHSGSPTGPALAGATVSLAGQTAVTSSTGAFTITGLANGTFPLTISKAGYITYSDEAFSVSSDISGASFFLTPLSTVSGIVHSGSISGPALAGATVSLAGQTAVTSSTGAFTISGLVNGTYTLTISKDGYTTYTNEAYSVTSSVSGASFFLSPLYTVSGTLHSGTATGPAIAGATVLLAGQTATTSSTGAFSISGIKGGTYTLTIIKEGYNQYNNSSYAVTANKTESGLFLTPIVYSLSGLVHNGDLKGPALASATVAIAGKTATTATNGTFSIANVPAGTYPLTVSKTGFASYQTTFTMDGNKAGQEFAIAPVYTVSGTVRAGSPTGLPLAGAVITAGDRSVTTSSTGAFSFTQVPAGTYDFTISAKGYSSYTAKQVVAGNVSGLSYYVTTTPIPNLINYKPNGWSDKMVISGTSGTVNIGSTSYYSNQTLYVDWAATNNGTGDCNTPFNTSVYVDNVWKASIPTASLGIGALVNGEFPIGPLTAGTHTIKVVVDSGSVVKEVSDTDNTYSKTITVLAPPSYSLGGTVRFGSSTGPVIAGATVSIAGKSVVTTALGTFSITGIVRGTYPLTISKPGYVTYTNENYNVTATLSGQVFTLRKPNAVLAMTLLPETAYGNGVWNYAVSLSETAGIGVTMDTVTCRYYDENSTLIATQTGDGAYFANWFGGGSAKIAANGTAGGTEYFTLGGKTTGSIVLTFSGTDDNGNKVSVSGTQILLPGQ